MSQDRPGDDHDQGKESETSSTQTATTADLTPTPYETIFNAIEDAAFVFDVSHLPIKNPGRLPTRQV
jgi:hypothetical protein